MDGDIDFFSKSKNGLEWFENIIPQENIETCGEQYKEIEVSAIKFEKDYLELYPNPTISDLTIRVNPSLDPNYYNIYSSSGTFVISGTLNKVVDKTIDVSSLASGLYYLQVVTENKKALVSKFIKE